MREFFEDVLRLPYKPNSQDNPLHENQVEELLIKHGIDYVAQPNGIQRSPDFRVNYSDNNYDIECKSSKGHYPTFNGGLPKPGVIYIFSSKKYDQTTIFFADDVVKESKRKLYNELLSEFDMILKRYQSNLGWQDDDRGFDFYMRAMYTQRGEAMKTDYFIHKERKRCEQKILAYNW